MAEHAVIIDVSRYHPASGRRNELLAAMNALAATTGGSEGCFGAQVCASDRDEEALVAISRWASPAALEAFAGSPDFMAERERMSFLLAGPAEHEHLRSLPT